jgi:hypothetical protein
MSLSLGVLLVAATMTMMTSRGQRTVLDESQHFALMALYDEAGLISFIIIIFFIAVFGPMKEANRKQHFLKLL